MALFGNANQFHGRALKNNKRALVNPTSDMPHEKWEYRRKAIGSSCRSRCVSMSRYKMNTMTQGVLPWQEEEEEDNGRWKRRSTRKSKTLDNATCHEECNKHGPWSEKEKYKECRSLIPTMNTSISHKLKCGFDTNQTRTLLHQTLLRYDQVGMKRQRAISQRRLRCRIYS